MTKLGGAGRAGGLISATVRTVRYYGGADKITVTRGHGQLTTSRILELESRKPPPLYPDPRAGSRLVLAPVPAILTPASPSDRDIAKSDYQTLTRSVCFRTIDIFILLPDTFILCCSGDTVETADPDHCSALRLYSAPQIL